MKNYPNYVNKIFIISSLVMCIAFGCSSNQNNSAQLQQQSSVPSQGSDDSGGMSGSSATGGTGGIDPEAPGDVHIEPYRPCASRPCAQRLPDPETEEDLKYSLPQ